MRGDGWELLNGINKSLDYFLECVIIVHDKTAARGFRCIAKNRTRSPATQFLRFRRVEMSALLSHLVRTFLYRCADQIAVRLPKKPTPEGAKGGVENTLSPSCRSSSLFIGTHYANYPSDL